MLNMSTEDHQHSDLCCLVLLILFVQIIMGYFMLNMSTEDHQHSDLCCLLLPRLFFVQIIMGYFMLNMSTEDHQHSDLCFLMLPGILCSDYHGILHAEHEHRGPPAL